MTLDRESLTIDKEFEVVFAQSLLHKVCKLGVAGAWQTELGGSNLYVAPELHAKVQRIKETHGGTEGVSCNKNVL